MTDATTELDADLKVDVEAIVEEAKESFTLIDSIKNRAMRTVKVNLGFDEVGSEKLAAVEASVGALRNIVERMERNSSGVDELKKLVAKLKRDLKRAEDDDVAADLQVQIDNTTIQIEQRTELAEGIAPVRVQLDELEAHADVIRTEVNKESLSIELRALPYSIARGSSRRARKALGITEKGIPEDLSDEFEERQMLELTFDQIARWRDNRTGETGTKLTMEQIETLRDFLPISQSGKLFMAVNDLQYKNAISESAIAQADF